MTKRKTILVAPLNWGLGHATRCIPIIKALQEHNFRVLLGSDGGALLLLRKEFPELPFVELPAYTVKYPKSGAFFKLKLLFALPRIRKAIASEKNRVQTLVEARSIHGIISDNRPGVWHQKVPTVYLTHQLNVLSGATSLFSSKMHQRLIKKFDVCWIPDTEGSVNLSGRLGHPENSDLKCVYMGPISRMRKRNVTPTHHILVLLSGPEPQRTLLEVKMMELFSNSNKSVILVRGVVEDEQRVFHKNKITIVNFMRTEELENAINRSRLVICRSGYTSIMDLAALEKDAFFIPTPGQYEQKYLARELKKRGIVPSCNQSDFQLEKLDEVLWFRGLKSLHTNPNYGQLFCLFESK